ncbi:MAG: DegT/DnrJ/EryC1/StrS family aminotransferase [Tatlockia sp.]|nr:DegT/DnrJ/EryC1/StrS family aminotransferase [Tatlockia sp.]
MQFIDLKKQYKLIETEVLQSIQAVLEHGQYIMGPEIPKLERQLADFIGVRHAIVNSSGTDALFMALLALDIKPGDEIITSPFSFFASAEVIALCHAKPVFVDIDPLTYNIDATKIAAVITQNTKAIMPVSLYGQCPDMVMINNIAKQYGLPVIEDAAQSFGATYNGVYSCALSTIGCTSFFPSKPLGGYGDAGACFTDDDNLAEKLIEIRNHGQHTRYSHSRIGINGRMDSIQAAILIEKMKLFPDEILMRQKVAQRYKNLLDGSVITPHVLPGHTSVFAQYTIEVPNRNQFQKDMQDLGIPTAVHYPISMHEQQALEYLGYRTGDFPHSERASKQVVSLPMHPYMTIEEQQRVADGVKICLATEMAEAL